MAVQKEFRIPGSMIVVGTANVGSLNILSGDLNITGGVTTTANVVVGGVTLTTKNINSNGVISLTTGETSGNPAASFQAGSSNFFILPSAAAGSYNTLTSANDTVLVSSFGSSNTGNLVLGVWSSRTSGLGIKIRSVTNDIQVAAASIVFGNTGLSVNGSVGSTGQILYSNGSSAYWGAQTPTGVTSVASANGIAGGTITGTGTLYAVAANGIAVTTAGINVQAGNSQVVSNTSGVFVNQAQIDHNSLSNYVANRHIDHSTVSITAGNGLTGGGTVDASRTLAVTAGNSQIVANSSGVFVNQAQIDHNSLSNYVANRHIDHSTVSITAGTGLSGGGTVDASRTLSLNTTYVAAMTVNNAFYLNSQPDSYYTNITARLGYTPVKQGTGTGQGSNTINIGWGSTGDGIKLQVDATNYSNVWPMSITGVSGAVANTITAGSGLSGSTYNGNAAVTWTLATAYGDTINPYASKTANFFLAAPNGSAGAPSFRAIVAADIPTLNQNTTGSAGSVSGVTLQSGLGTSNTPTFSGLIISNIANTNIFNASGNTQVSSLGVGTAASGTAGEIRATNDITAYYSDRRLKDVHGTIDSALDKVNALTGVYFNANEIAARYGYDTEKRQVGVIAQEVHDILPEVTSLAPFDATFINGIEQSISGENYLTVHYEKLVPLLIEAIKELTKEVNELKAAK